MYLGVVRGRGQLKMNMQMREASLSGEEEAAEARRRFSARRPREDLSLGIVLIDGQRKYWHRGIRLQDVHNECLVFPFLS